jgi:hypothetical protein
LCAPLFRRNQHAIGRGPLSIWHRLTGIFSKRFYNWAEQQFKGIKITASAAIYYFVPPSKPLRWLKHFAQDLQRPFGSCCRRHQASSLAQTLGIV